MKAIIRSTQFRKRAFALALTVFAGVALAIVTFDPATLEGFVGKGDVQSAFGWNNATMQARHLGIEFEYRVSEVKNQNCSVNEGGGVFTVVTKKVSSNDLNSQIVKSDRQKNQYVGWDLLGCADEDNDQECDTTETHTVTCTDVSGDTHEIDCSNIQPNGCPSGSNPQGANTTVSSTEGLYAVDTYPNGTGTNSVLIWPPAP